MDRILCVVQWIGSYVSCTGIHVLEQTVQGARHIRCIVLRSSTDGRWLLQGKSGKSGVARFVQYGDCIGTLLPPSDRAYTSPCRTSNAARGRRLAAHALFDAAYQRISSGRTSAVSPKLSRSDLVQCGLCDAQGYVALKDEKGVAPRFDRNERHITPMAQNASTTSYAALCDPERHYGQVEAYLCARSNTKCRKNYVVLSPLSMRDTAAC